MRAGFSPVTGSKDEADSSSIPRSDLSIGSGYSLPVVDPAEGGETAEKAEAVQAQEARNRAAMIVFMVYIMMFVFTSLLLAYIVDCCDKILKLTNRILLMVEKL